MKWSDIVYIAIIIALSIFAFKDCGKAKRCPELKCPNVDSLIALVDSISQLPPDTVVTTKIVSKVVIKRVVSTDTISINPPIVTYVTVNDTSYRAFVVDTIKVQGELLEHKQAITYLDEVNTIYLPVPSIVEVHDTLKVPYPVEKVVAPKWQVSVGGNLTYVNGKLYPAPMIQMGIDRFNFGIAKPFDNASSFIFEASYRILKK